MEQVEKVFALIIRDKNLKDDLRFAEEKEEFIGLAKACDMEVVVETVIKPKTLNNSTYIGSGNIEMVSRAIDTIDVDSVIVNVGLTGSQIRNLQKELKKNVLDKNMVLLQIFSKRARSAESKARVEIANLNYMMSRMVGSYEELGRQSGRGSGKNRGLGETKLELDRRHVQKRITLLKKQLKQFDKQRDTQKKKRNAGDDFKVALIGYTNAGKSSLMNTMLLDQSKGVLEQDMVFASLDTTSRRIVREDAQFILHDTVGYIEDLPKALYPAFQSTRDEIEDADLILHIVDRSAPDYLHKQEVIQKYLESMEIGAIPVWIVYTKTDLVDLEFEDTESMLYVSNRNQKTIERLIDKIKDFEATH